jgi:hypothetical protein
MHTFNRFKMVDLKMTRKVMFMWTKTLFPSDVGPNARVDYINCVRLDTFLAQASAMIPVFRACQ